MIYHFVMKPKPKRGEGFPFCIIRGAESTTVCRQKFPQPSTWYQVPNAPGAVCTDCAEGCPEALVPSKYATVAKPSKTVAVAEAPEPLDDFEALWARVQKKSAKKRRR